MACLVLTVLLYAKGIATLFLLGYTLVVFWETLIDALGSFAIAAQVLFVIALAAIIYLASFRMPREQKSAMSLAMSTRNGGAMFASLLAFPVIDPNVFVMILLAVPVPVFVAFGIAGYLSTRTAKADEEGLV